VRRTLHVSQEHLDRFATASGDRNPLHLDDSFARQTPYGRCIAHGALVAVAALGVADAARLRSVDAIDLHFKQPVFPGEDYTISLAESKGQRMRIEVAGRGKVAATVIITSDPDDAPLPSALKQGPAAYASSPRPYTLEELAQADLSLHEQYGGRPELLAALAADLGAEHVPDSILVWLAAASYTIGMLVPGRDALFVRARLVRSSRASSGALTVSVSAADDRTGLVSLDATLDHGEASTRMALQSFVRPPVPAPDRSSIDRYLPPSDELSSRTVFVVGGSRGLGAALSGAFATQGATVWAGFARSAMHVERLRLEFGQEKIHPLQFDAEDPHETQAAVDAIRRSAGALDGIVLCAAPALCEATLHPDASAAALLFLRSSLALSLVPLAESVQLLSPDGWLVLMSSAALDDPPEAWPYYVIAKAAVEGAAAYCARHTAARVLVVRAPGMWTDSTNTPMGRIGAVAKEEVAAAIVRWAITGETSSLPAMLTAEDLTSLRPDR
jgi:NAD(P)-dependent dehydrogenase (short-subunit alcohol dehydrogenase family)/acyl dehydratase